MEGCRYLVLIAAGRVCAENVMNRSLPSGSWIEVHEGHPDEALPVSLRVKLGITSPSATLRLARWGSEMWKLASVTWKCAPARLEPPQRLPSSGPHPGGPNYFLQSVPST